MAKREKKQQVEEKGDDTFAMMFCSLNLILLSFFILLNALSVRDEKRTRKAIGSLRGSFGVLTGGESPDKEGASLSFTNPMDRAGRSTGGKVKEAIRSMIRRVKMGFGRHDVSVVRTADGLVLSFAERIVFQPGGVDLDPRIFPVLDQMATVLDRYPVKVIVRGYSDPRRPRGYPSNIELSGTRAVRVARFLVEAAGLPGERVSAEGRGPNRKQQDKRYVEVVIPNSELEDRLSKVAK